MKLVNAALGALVASALAVTGVGFAGKAQAADYPEKPITITFPWASGHPVNALLRVLGEYASKELGQPFVVTSVTGAGGKKAMLAGAQAEPDGYTLTNNWVAPQIAGKLFDPSLAYDNSSFIAIAGLTSIPFTLTVSVDNPANTLDEFKAWAAEQGRPLNYGVCAGQSVPRLVGEQFMQTAGVDYVPIPNNTGCLGDNMSGLLNGSLDVAVGLVPATSIFAGQVKHLALLSDVPHPQAPDLPTSKEQGVPIGWGGAALGWSGLVVPAGTPDDVVAKLREVIGKTVQSQEFRDALGPQANLISYVPPAEFEELWAASSELLAPHVQAILGKK